MHVPAARPERIEYWIATMKPERAGCGLQDVGIDVVDIGHPCAEWISASAMGISGTMEQQEIGP